MNPEFWNERYAAAEAPYGTEPNVFFKQQLDLLEAGNILLPAEGDGRNAVYAASRSWQVSAFDLSTTGRQKTLERAGSFRSQIDYQVGDCGQVSYPEAHFDVLAFVFAHFPADVKIQYYQKLATYLKPGGTVILELFSKEHLQLREANPAVGGPPVLEMLWSVEEIQSCFPNYPASLLVVFETDLSEGKYHNGRSSVVRFVGTKPSVA
jgi:SAM-dependent methyltransferase